MYQKTEVIGNDTLNYEATIEGRSYENEDYPRLDSIKFNLRGFYTKEDKIITNTIIKREKQRKWHISPSIGVGYGLVNHKPDIYVGVSFGYTIN